MAGSGGFEPPDLGSKPSMFPSYITSPEWFLVPWVALMLNGIIFVKQYCIVFCKLSRDLLLINKD